jgi:hypothetical protein
MTSNAEVINLFFELVPTNALVLTGLANFRAGGEPEVICFIRHTARWRRFFRCCLAASNFRSRSA